MEKMILELSVDEIWDRFWSRVQSNGSCWEWQGAKNEDGYGMIRINRRSFRAHRISYVLAYQVIPDGKIICHTCDNPSCVNPIHLYAGTLTDNNRDTYRRRRHPGNNRRDVFTPEDIQEIRNQFANGKDTAALSRDWKTAQRYIQKILVGDRYPFAPGPIASKKRKSSRNHGATLTEQEAREIKRLLRLGHRQAHIAVRLGVSPAIISAIHLGKSYVWVTD